MTRKTAPRRGRRFAGSVEADANTADRPEGAADDDAQALMREVQETLLAVGALLAARRAQQRGWPARLDRRFAGGARENLACLAGEAARAIREDLAALKRILDLERKLPTPPPTAH